MLLGSAPLVALLLLASLPSAGAAAPSSKRIARAEELAELAWAAERRGEHAPAAKLANQALKLDRGCVRAHYVLGETLVAVSTGNDSEEAKWLYSAAMVEMGQVVALSPDSFMGAVAANYLRPATDLSVLEPPVLECSAAANTEFQRGEVAWSGHDYLGAQVAYNTAILACPNHAGWWLNSGDAWYGLEDYKGAIARYDKALELYPCYAAAYRFRADAEIEQGDLTAGFVDATRAVACNPGYDIGWTYLSGLWSQLDSSVVWKRPPVSPSSGDEAEVQAWKAYWDARGQGLPAPAGDAEAIAHHLQAASVGIDAWRSAGGPAAAQAGPQHPMWAELAEARDAGVIEPAMFVWLLDTELAPLFGRWRHAHLSETVSYISDHLVESTTQAGSQP